MLDIGVKGKTFTAESAEFVKDAKNGFGLWKKRKWVANPSQLNSYSYFLTLWTYSVKGISIFSGICVSKESW